MKLTRKKCFFYFRGVIQTLVEKHFPAPDRKKFFDIFGLNGGNYSEDSNLSSSGGIKRKRGILVDGFSFPLTFSHTVMGCHDPEKGGLWKHCGKRRENAGNFEPC